MAEFSHQVLTAFAHLYYYVPTFAKPLKVNLPVGKTVSISEPKDAILWLCELLVETTGKSCCRQSDLKSLVVYWYPTARDNFSTILGELEDRDECIKRLLDRDIPDRKNTEGPRDNRSKWVMLTPTGQKVLERIKSKRQRDLKALLSLLGRRDLGMRERILQNLDVVGSAAWLSMLKKAKIRSGKRPNVQ